jgi:hypothetical protein
MEGRSGLTMANIITETVLFTRLFSAAVGKNGRMFVFDIPQDFTDYLKTRSRESQPRSLPCLR